MKIIAVDDENGARKLLEMAIRDNLPGEEIHVFSSSEDALRESKSIIPDIAFLDINMPGITGIDAAKELKNINPNVNIIFVTGYSEFAREAFSIHASGYLSKPVTSKDVKRELEHLRNSIPRPNTEKKVYIKTFGNFEVLVNDHHIKFHRGLAKEALAYFVNRRGASVSRKELAGILFEDTEYSRSTQSYITQIIKSLIQTLTEEGIADILDVTYNAYAVNTTKFQCDSYDYLDGCYDKNAVIDEYMAQYSWSEQFIGKFIK